ncbi:MULTISPECIES: glycoside hydrolase family protein [unclassified Achromobacter]|uniref:glycoside hydrolase family 24 protein n=1 Tax=unclassified Achromobacter TaxID=2626865 RepID=UPI000B51DB96|nr:MULTISPECIES: glycoside hydrolase family 104 protein [unclassified Achromobacter]OWT69199.1 lysozyme [Achromobacter sp. HZ34]OWT70604.1 lysozyme [Achromobacter sp. HZ28]
MARISAVEAGGRNVLAFLDMLAYSEGTDNGRQPTNDHGYDVVVGGQTFLGYDDHPRIFVSLPQLGIKSSAAGRYQLLARYWDAYRVQLKLKGGFTPENQDRVAIQQIRECRAIPDIQAGRFDAAVVKVKRIWASLPGAGYGQHEQDLATLRAIYTRAGGELGA